MAKHTLADGRTATVRPGKVKDLVAAHRIAKAPEEIPFALIAVLTTVDGQPLIYEDLLEMDLADVLPLVEEVSAGKALSPAPGMSSTSAPRPGGASLTSAS